MRVLRSSLAELVPRSVVDRHVLLPDHVGRERDRARADAHETRADERLCEIDTRRLKKFENVFPRYHAVAITTDHAAERNVDRLQDVPQR